MLSFSRLQCLVVLGVLAVLGATPNTAAAECPTAVLFEPADTGATMDAGWQGYAHDQPVFGTMLHLALGCAASTPPCGTCPIAGVVANPYGHRQRCRNDLSIECTVATEVAACGAADTCRYYLSPPQSLATGGLATCHLTELAGPINGSVDVESGAFAAAVPARALLYNGVVSGAFGGGYIQGCPRCEGDAVPNDSVQDGTCDAGPRAGLSCDAHGTSPLADFGSASFDCPPTSGVVVVHLPLGTFSFSTEPQSVALTGASPNCHGISTPTTPCFCSTCNTAAAEPCFANADCPPSGGNPGICRGRRCLGGSNNGSPCAQSSECPAGGICGQPGEPTRPNACLDDTSNPSNCTPDGDSDGICGAGPVENRCANHPDRGCDEDADCDDVPGACVAFFQSCYPDNGVLGGTVSVTGAATPPISGIAIPTDLGSLTCLPPSSSSWTNIIWGLPGLARMHQPGRLVFGDAPGPGPSPTPSLSPTPTPSPTFDPCPAAPDLCRPPAIAQKASLQLTDRSPDDKDQLAWKWAKGTATSMAELGNPLGSDAYQLCLYDASGLRASMTVPSGGTCRGQPCWQQRSTGFIYRNKDAGPHGITQLTLKAGVDGKAQMQAKGKGGWLPMPALASLTTTLQVQLRHQTSGLCWGATYSPPFDTSTAERLKDTAD